MCRSSDRRSTLSLVRIAYLNDVYFWRWNRVPGEIKRGGRWSWTLTFAQKRSWVGRWSWAEQVGRLLLRVVQVVRQQRCNGHCLSDCPAQQLKEQLHSAQVAGQWRGDTALTLPLFWRRSTVSPVFFGRFPRSSQSLSRPRPLPTLSQSLIGHLASVDVKQHKSKRWNTAFEWQTNRTSQVNDALFVQGLRYSWLPRMECTANMSTHTRVWFSHFCVHVKRAKWQSNQARNSPCTLRLTCCCLLHVSFQRTSAPLIELSDLSGSLSLDLTGLEFQANLGQLLVPQSRVCVMLLWGLMSSEVGLTYWGQRVCVNHIILSLPKVRKSALSYLWCLPQQRLFTCFLLFLLLL